MRRSSWLPELWVCTQVSGSGARILGASVSETFVHKPDTGMIPLGPILTKSIAIGDKLLLNEIPFDSILTESPHVQTRHYLRYGDDGENPAKEER